MKDKKKTPGFIFAWNGIVKVVKTEQNFRIHLFAVLIVFLTGFFLGLSSQEWMILCVTISTVLVAEMFNSAIEGIMDFINPELHPAVKIIKDISAGSVLLAAIFSVVIGLIIFIPKLYILLI